MLKEEIDAAVTSLNDFIDRFENASNLNGEAQLPIYRDLYNKYYGPYEIDGTEHVSVSDSLGLLEGTGEHSDLVIKFKVLFPFIRDKVLSGKYTPE